MDSDHGLAGFLEEYPGGKSTAIGYYESYFDDKSVMLGNPREGGANGMFVSDSAGNFNLRTGLFVSNPDDFTRNSSYIDSSEDVIKWRKIYPDGSALVFYHSNNEAEARKFIAGYEDNTGKPIGYAVIVYRNGVVEHWDQQDGAGIKTLLPAAFTDELTREYVDMQAMFHLAERTAASAQTKLNIYTRRICAGEISVDYLDSKLYGQICLEDGDMSPYSGKIAAARSGAEDRRERNKLLAQQNAEKLVQQQIVARQNAAAQSAQVGAAAQDFNQSMSALNQNMAAFTQSMRNNSSNNAPTWGNPQQRKVLNCFEMGNIVTCR